ncbi:tetratricopeptide repeat protein [Halpernia sp. GG3]
MKYYISIIILFFFIFTFGQQQNYSKWKEDAKTEIRLLPKYGNHIKTQEQKEADEELIKTYLAQEGSHRRASELLVNLGFKYLYKNDLKTAMYRFNQAWLLDPTNEDVFWGFGGIYFSFGDFENALKQYDEGLKLNPKSSKILTDKATIYMTGNLTNNRDKDSNLALKLFNQSYNLDPKNQNTLFKMSACYFFKNDCKNALRYYNECQKLGGEPITSEYKKALASKCKK